MKIAVVVPVFLSKNTQLDELTRMTRSIQTKKYQIVFIAIENYIHPNYSGFGYEFTFVPEEVCRIPGRQPQSVAKAWNDGIRIAFEKGCDYCIVANEDIIMRSDAIDQLVDFATAHQEAILWSMRDHDNLATLENTFSPAADEHPHFSCFMVGKNFVEKVGTVDENFHNSYFEDNDLHARVVLSGNMAIRCLSAVFFHYGSLVIRTDQAKANENTMTYQQNQNYFLSKWGHANVNEPAQMVQYYFKHPYNESDKPLSYWRP